MTLRNKVLDFRNRSTKTESFNLKHVCEKSGEKSWNFFFFFHEKYCFDLLEFSLKILFDKKTSCLCYFT